MCVRAIPTYRVYWLYDKYVCAANHEVEGWHDCCTDIVLREQFLLWQIYCSVVDTSVPVGGLVPITEQADWIPDDCPCKTTDAFGDVEKQGKS